MGSGKEGRRAAGWAERPRPLVPSGLWEGVVGDRAHPILGLGGAAGDPRLAS